MTTLPGEAQITAMVESWAVLSNIIEAHISEYHKDQQRHMDRWEIDGDSVVMHCSTYSSCSGEERYTESFPVSDLWEKTA